MKMLKLIHKIVANFFQRAACVGKFFSRLMINGWRKEANEMKILKSREHSASEWRINQRK
jgi:hypothetical protein